MLTWRRKKKKRETTAVVAAIVAAVAAAEERGFEKILGTEMDDEKKREHESGGLK